MISRFRALTCLLAIGASLGLAACETAPPPAPLAPVYVPLPPPPPLPNVAVSQGVVEHAAVFQGYMQRASAVRADFQAVGQIQERLTVAQAYEPAQLQRGVVAYGAIVALQDPTFVRTIREFGRDPTQRQELVRRLVANPGYVANFEGASGAAGLVVSALQNQALTLLGAGNRVKQAAYDTQRQRPFLADIPGRPERLRAAQAVGVQPLVADPFFAEPLRNAAVGATPIAFTGEAVAAPYTASVARALTVAALAALGEADGANAQVVESLLAEPVNSYCFNLSKLNLYQCLSVAKPYYEDVFCLGQHILIDTANCVGRASGRALAPPAPPALTTATNLTPVPQGQVAAAVGGAPPSVASRAPSLAPSATPAPPVSLPGTPVATQPISPDAPVPTAPR